MAIHRGSDIKGGGGHEIAETGSGFKNLPDCPICRYGTLDMHPCKKGYMLCIDCGAEHSTAHLVAMRVLPRGACP